MPVYRDQTAKIDSEILTATLKTENRWCQLCSLTGDGEEEDGHILHGCAVPCEPGDDRSWRRCGAPEAAELEVCPRGRRRSEFSRRKEELPPYNKGWHPYAPRIFEKCVVAKDACCTPPIALKAATSAKEAHQIPVGGEPSHHRGGYPQRLPPVGFSNSQHIRLSQRICSSCFVGSRRCPWPPCGG
jgi:hypothetical protein